MFTKRLKMNFDTNEPIFTSEILDLFGEYSRAYVFRLMDKAEKDGEIVKFNNGVYFLPTKTIIGTSTITAEDVVRKKYIGCGNDVYGVYSGLNLQNMFSVTTQMPNTIEVVSNKESMRCRKVTVDGRTIILRRSRCDINKNNAKAYTILQLLTEIDAEGSKDAGVKDKIKKYMTENKITSSDLISLAGAFPAKTMKNLMRSGVLA